MPVEPYQWPPEFSHFPREVFPLAVLLWLEEEPEPEDVLEVDSPEDLSSAEAEEEV